jgi:hypothetical protein
VLPANPAAAVRGPKHVVTKGSAPVLNATEARTLLDGIDLSTIVGLRDRALIGVMVYSFASAPSPGCAAATTLSQGRRGWLRLHEKGRKRHDVHKVYPDPRPDRRNHLQGILDDPADRAWRRYGRWLHRRAPLLAELGEGRSNCVS